MALQEELKSESCKAEVQRRMQRAARDIRFDEVLAVACTEDRKKYCSDVSPVCAALFDLLRLFGSRIQMLLHVRLISSAYVVIFQ